MRYLFTALLLLLCAASAQAGVFVGFGSSAAPIDYLINEDFEGTGTPTDWTVVSGTVDFDYATGCPSGSQCVSLGPGAVIDSPTFTDADETWTMFRARVTGSIATNPYFVSIYNSATIRASVALRYNPRFGATVSGVVESYGSDISKDTWYYVLHRYVKGTANDAVSTTWYSADGASWTQAVSLTTGTAYTAGTKVRIENDNGSDIIVIDKMQVSEVDPR